MLPFPPLLGGIGTLPMLAARIQAHQAQQAMTNQIAQETQLLARRELFQRDLAQRLQVSHQICGFGANTPGGLNPTLFQRLASQAQQHQSLATIATNNTSGIILKPEVKTELLKLPESMASPPMSLPVDTGSNRSSPHSVTDSATSNIHTMLFRKIQSSQMDTTSSKSGKSKIVLY